MYDSRNACNSPSKQNSERQAPLEFEFCQLLGRLCSERTARPLVFDWMAKTLGCPSSIRTHNSPTSKKPWLSTWHPMD